MLSCERDKSELSDDCVLDVGDCTLDVGDCVLDLGDCALDVGDCALSSRDFTFNDALSSDCVVSSVSGCDSF